MLTKFVDRADEFAVLDEAAAELRRGHGGALVFAGRSGIGKSALLERFAAQFTPGGEPAVRTVFTRPLPGIGAGLAYAPVIEVLLGLQHRKADQRSKVHRMLRGAGIGAAKSAPDVLTTLVPGLGPLFAMGRAVTESALKAGSMPLDSLLPFQQSVALRIAEEISRSVSLRKPAVVIVDDVQYIDSSSLLVLDLLLRRMDKTPLMLLLGLTEQTQPDVPARTVTSLIDKWVEERLVARRPLGGLPLSAVQELVGLLKPAAPVELSTRLAETTGGLPVFVTLCLDQWKPSDGAYVPLPESVSDVVRRQLAELDEVDRRLLALAAVQGVAFVSSLVARLAELPHDEVLSRLHALARTRQLIRTTAKPDWAVLEEADAYQFDHLLLWDAVYREQSEEQRRSRHERTAHALVTAVPEADQAPMGLRLELARQLQLGGRPCLRAAVDVCLGLARSAAIGGLSFAEAEMHIDAAINAARAMPQGPERDRRLVGSIEMLLSMTEVRWRGQVATAGAPANIDELAAEAEQAAARTGDPALIAVTTWLRGKTLLATHGLEPGLAKLEEAVERATVLDDPVRRYVATVDFGRQVSKRNLAQGLAVMREAEQMYATDPRLSGGDNLVLQHARNLAEMQLAVTLFDSGSLGDALSRLTRCVARLRDEPLNAELPIALNYLAQVQIALGQDQAAEETLREALAFEERRGGDSGWHAYNSALLAGVLAAARPRRTEQALELAQEAWLETERTWLLNLVPIVRNLYAEVLLDASATAHPDLAAQYLERADRLATATCVETLRSGMTRSRIPALVLLARIHTRSGRSTQGADFARQAVAVLDEVGDMPALRTEEVYFHAANVLWLDGDEAEARELLERARTVVAAKAERIEDAALREGFLRNVALNRWITDGLPGEGR